MVVVLVVTPRALARPSVHHEQDAGQAARDRRDSKKRQGLSEQPRAEEEGPHGGGGGDHGGGGDARVLQAHVEEQVRAKDQAAQPPSDIHERNLRGRLTAGAGSVPSRPSAGPDGAARCAGLRHLQAGLVAHVPHRSVPTLRRAPTLHQPPDCCGGSHAVAQQVERLHREGDVCDEEGLAVVLRLEDQLQHDGRSREEHDDNEHKHDATHAPQ
mmetsp:Transcript_17348/g.58372  ORF Transcript_17348/g.58372 Transcript_17348/m.58372 type:complete len:213 (+) Transcript_17348:565-1203(+)